jgi:hypothetical protein
MTRIEKLKKEAMKLTNAERDSLASALVQTSSRKEQRELRRKLANLLVPSEASRILSVSILAHLQQHGVISEIEMFAIVRKIEKGEFGLEAARTIRALTRNSRRSTNAKQKKPNKAPEPTA